MSSKSETGHAKNVANFQKLIAFIKGYAAKYNPSQAAIKLPALNTLLASAQQTLKSVIAALKPFIPAVNAREIVFAPLNKLVTRIVNALDASGESDQIVADARTLSRKIQGKRASKAKATPSDPAGTSASQQSFDMRLENFKKLVSLVSGEPLYIPNEPDLKVTALNAVAADLTAKNDAVISITVELSNSRIARNKTLYNPKTGLVDIALEVKKYVKSLFGATAPEFKQISPIEFKRIKD